MLLRMLNCLNITLQVVSDKQYITKARGHNHVLRTV